MQRTWLGTVACVAFFSLSCGVGQVTSTIAEPVLDTAGVIEATPTAPVAIAEEDPQIEALINYLAAQPTGLTKSELRDLAVAITDEVARQRLDLRLILALMYVESRYQPFAVSHVGAMGLMQILPSTGKELAGQMGIEWYGPETLFDPVVNVRLGIAYVKKLTNRYEKVSTALAAYNWGMGNIDKKLRGGRPLPRIYPGLVMDAYGRTLHAVNSSV
jgi:soluble lytic murein transglycosylase